MMFAFCSGCQSVLMREEVLACFDPQWPNLKIAVACFDCVTLCDVQHSGQYSDDVFPSSWAEEWSSPRGKRGMNMSKLDNEICELNIDELDSVSGGILGLLLTVMGAEIGLIIGAESHDGFLAHAVNAAKGTGKV
jgi:hypothetical protein